MSDDLPTMLARMLRDAPPDTAATATDDRILDAALVEVGAHGPRAATIDQIAERAGVGRITVFRRFESKERLIARLGMRELQRFLGAVQAAAQDVVDPADRIVDAFAACVRAGEEHPLVARMARNEPGALFAQLTRGTPSALDLAVAFVASHVAAMQSQTGHRAGDPAELADILVRVTLTHVLAPSPRFAAGDDTAARDYARRALVPIVLGDRAPGRALRPGDPEGA